jgi:RNA polymerase sigma-B factor
MLPAREQRVIGLRFVGDMTQAQIAARIGVSQMHVSRLLTRSMIGLRDAMQAADGDTAARGAGRAGLSRGVGQLSVSRVLGPDTDQSRSGR